MSNQLQVTGEAKIRDIQGPVVANSGVITALDGDANQYVRGDGTLADFPTSTGGGSSVSYYLNSSVSQGTIGGNAYRELSKEPIIGAGTDIAISSNGYIANYITDANDPDVILIPGGNFNCEFYFSVNNNTGNPFFYAELYKYDGTTFTLLGSSVGVPEYINQGTTINPYYFAIPVATATLALTDRLAIRIYVNVDGRTVTLHTENSHLCQVVTTLSKGMVSLNNLTDQSQFITTGTSGTNFNINSSGDTHTFNLPIASATNTGKLSSTDWTTFNNKQPAGNYVTLDTTQTITGQKTFSTTLFGTDAEFSSSILSPIVSILDSSTYTKVVRLQTLAATNRDVYFPDLNGTVALLEGSQTFTGAKTFSSVITGDAGISLKEGVVPSGVGYTGLAGDADGLVITKRVGATAYTNLLSFTTSTSNTYSFPNASGTIALTSNLSSYVPYTGATADVDLGTRYFKATGVQTESAFALKILTAGIAFQNGYSVMSSLAGTFSITQAVSAGNLKSMTFDFSAWATNSSYTYALPAANGTIALTSNLSSYVPYAGATSSLNLGTNDVSSKFVFVEGDGTQGGILSIRQYAASYSVTTDHTNIYAIGNTKLNWSFFQVGGNNKIVSFDVSSITNAVTRTYTLPDATGTLALTSNLSSYVPYSGATTNVNLGTNDIISRFVRVDGDSGASGVLHFKHNASGSTTGAIGFTSLFISSTNIFGISYSSTGDTRIAKFSAAGLSTNANRTYTLPDATGTLALTSDLGNYVTLDTTQTITGAKTFTIGVTKFRDVYVEGSGTSASGVNLKQSSGGIAYAGAGYMTINAFGTKQIGILDGATQTNAYISLNSITSGISRTYTLPDDNGTLALTSNLSAYLPLTGGTLTGGLYINPTNTGVTGLDVASNNTSFRSDNLEGSKRQLLMTMGSGTLISLTGKGYEAARVTDIAFYTSTSGGVNASPSIYMTGSGNVGIGTGTTSGKLDVRASGTSAFTYYFRNSAGGYGGGIYNTGSNNTQLYLATSAGTENVLIAASGNSFFNGGNVGIGTDTPGGKLQIVGGDFYLGSYHATNKIALGADTNHYVRYNTTLDGAEVSGYSGVMFSTLGGTERMRISTYGDVFIGGTTSLSSGALIVGDNSSTRPIVSRTSGGVDGTYSLGIALYPYNTTEHHQIQSTVSSNGAASGVRFLISNGGGSSGVTESLRINRGSVTVIGSLSKGSGSFKIDHPIESMKCTHHLVHSFVESPQANNIYRGKVQLQNGMAKVNLDEVSTMTQGTFVLLNREIHTYTSNETDWDAVRGKVEENILTIECQNSESNAIISWLVIGERQDKHMIDTDWTDNNGKVIVEPLKNK